MDYQEFQDEIDELVEAGVLERVQSRDGSELRFTEDGLDFTKFQIGLDTDMQLFLFSIMWRRYGEYESEYRKLIEIALDLRDQAEINILRTINANPDRLSGIEVERDLPEDFLEVFDPEI